MPNCTMPKIPYFRDWFESKFSDLCNMHDLGYVYLDCKLCCDFRLAAGIAERGYPFIGLLTFFAVNLPWVWIKWALLQRKGR